MATRLGYEVFQDGTGSPSFTLNIPSGTELVVLCIAGYFGGTDYMASPNTQPNIDNTDMTTVVSDDDQTNCNIMAWALKNPTTGASVSFDCEWRTDQSPSEGLTFWFIYMDDVDISGTAAQAIRSSGSDPSSSTSHSVGALSAQSGDYFIGWSQDYSSTDQTSWTGATEVDDDLYRSDWCEWAYAEPTSNITVSITTGDSYSGLGGLVLKGSSGGTTLTVSDAEHTHSLDAVTLTQAHNMSVNALEHTHNLDALTLTQSHNLTVGALEHSHSLDAPTLTQSHNLSVDALEHSHALDALTLVQAHVLALSDLEHTHNLESPTLSVPGAGTLVVESLSHSHALDAIVLTQAHLLSVAALEHGHSLDSLTLAQAHSLVVTELQHSHALDEATLSRAVSLTVSDLSHTHTIDGVTLVQAHVLSVDDLGHTHSLGTVNLSQKHLLALQDLLHSHSLDTVNFDVADGYVEITVTASSATITFTASNPSVATTVSRPSVNLSVN
jgi:hypothetical protein